MSQAFIPGRGTRRILPSVRPTPPPRIEPEEGAESRPKTTYFHDRTRSIIAITTAPMSVSAPASIPIAAASTDALCYARPYHEYLESPQEWTSRRRYSSEDGIIAAELAARSGSRKRLASVASRMPISQWKADSNNQALPRGLSRFSQSGNHRHQNQLVSRDADVLANWPSFGRLE